MQLDNNHAKTKIVDCFNTVMEVEPSLDHTKYMQSNPGHISRNVT